ncbi:MAG: SPASM domain-containing protein [Candidatus Pacearchaeota archaeon]|jgi:sulfatase maturation enzyme AslB (radical SAM superfamily)
MEDNIVIELTLDCDKFCRHCFRSCGMTRKHEESEMEFPTLTRILDEVIWTNEHRNFRKIKSANLTGGEPIIWGRKEHTIGDGVRAVFKRGLKPRIITSSTCPGDKLFDRYVSGVESLEGVGVFDVFHSFNLYMIGEGNETDKGRRIEDRLTFTIPLFDNLFGEDRHLGFLGVYDAKNREETLTRFHEFMKGLGLKMVKSQSTRDWEKKSEQGKKVWFIYRDGSRTADGEFYPIKSCAGHAKANNLQPVAIKTQCYVLDGVGIRPTVAWDGKVYPCWEEHFPSTRPLGNLHQEHLATILGRERAYLEDLRERIKRGYDKGTDICKFCTEK